ncbi:[protein-PII] uridylyltransferase [Sandaracinus amylolyticus]|uniref:Bifunctional uridylyltransferase/uridylyl-removing enzyme n=1 Tax=Sandaracinus amylolyticus TaxID=927083 RepID=A0A0F6W4E0_9BACT|nr:[protein-PII] uridylyltransferase [Sandaracinus amylolyticus]AKF07123.1 [Protein-PII] uridylyltransferase [Sandaracinus amylolyticus]
MAEGARSSLSGRGPGGPAPSLDLATFAPGLGKTCEEYRATYRERLAEMVRRGESGVRVASMHARILDGLLSALYCASIAAAKTHGRGPRGRTALLAVGGYGRGLLGLHSDLDVVVLCEDPGDPGAALVAQALLYPLWDLGLEIGHAVRGVDETLALARDDLRTATTLLDVRRVSGDASLVDELLRGARRHVFEPAMSDILTALATDTDARHERYGGSRFLLEPEVKNGCGGLRDLDVILWTANVRWAARSLEEAVAQGVLLHREAQELDAARELLWRVRNLLHARGEQNGGSGRRHDRLTFEDQEDVSAQMGFVDDGVSLGVEQFMQTYYRHARVVETGVERMLSRARHHDRKAPAPLEELGGGVLVFDGHVTLRESEALERDPALALRLYRQVVRRNLPPYAFARDAIARAAADPVWCERLRASREAADLFLELLTHVGDAPVRRGSMLAELHEVGVLLAMIPEFEPVTGRVQHDVYHVYTVDVHSVAAVDRLRALMRGDHASDLPMPTRLAADVPRPMTLFLGVLLHDIGKGRGGHHATIGAQLSVPIGERLGLTPGDVLHVRWLVEEHLSLYHWALRRDITDPDTIAEVVRRVGTLDRLRDLYVLTVADLSTTNPNAMTSWKARMLDDLYLATAAWLEAPAGQGGEQGEKRADAIRDQVRVGFVGDGRQAELESFLASMPDRYVLANPVDVIRAHARVVRDRDARTVHVALRPGPSEEVAELVVVTDDRPGLLADVAAVLASSRLDITTAQIHTRPRAGSHDEAFDVFQVRRTGAAEGEPVDRELVSRIQKDLEDLVTGRVSAKDLLARRAAPPAWARKHMPAVKTEILVDDDVSPRFTVIDVFTRDRVGLLHAIARTLHEQGLSIALSKVTTEGERVADVFYVTDERGAKLRDGARVAALKDALRAAIDALAERDAR